MTLVFIYYYYYTFGNRFRDEFQLKALCKHIIFYMLENV